MSKYVHNIVIFTMETFEEDIEKWGSRESFISYVKRTKNEIYFEITGYKFKIFVPENYPNGDDFMFVENVDKRIQWISEMNGYSVDRRPTLYKLLNYINKQYKKRLEQEDPSEQDYQIEQDNFRGVDDYEIELCEAKGRLEMALPSSKSRLSVDGSQPPTLFKGNVPGHILINEYLKLKNMYKDRDIKLEAVKNNPYHWNIKVSKFKNDSFDSKMKLLKGTFGYDYVEFEIDFHDTLYPNYPPAIKVVRPRLKNSLMHKISNMRMISIDYWTPTRQIEFIIEKLIDVVSKHGEIDIDDKINSLDNTDGSYTPLENQLIKLASLCDSQIEDDVDEEKYKMTVKIEVSKSTEKGPWKSGTGYGGGFSKKWDVNEYVKLQEEKNRLIQGQLTLIVNTLQNYNNMQEMSVIIKSSLLFKFIKSYLQGTTILEIQKNKNTYHTLFQIMSIASTSEFADMYIAGDISLYDVFEDIYEQAYKTKKITKQSDETIDMILTLHGLLEHVKEHKSKIKGDDTVEEHSDKLEDIYQEKMEELKFDTCTFAVHKFLNESKQSSKILNPGRIGTEVMSLSTSIPIHYDSSIFVRTCESNMQLLRVLITGPDKTPYDSGCFIFDAMIPSNFPNNSPSVLLVNTGGMRFNPNLYNTGKVCLSLLGTWSGSGGENWNPKTSTLSQVFISIQSQILTDSPFFNEPGYERYIGTPNGTVCSKNYNTNIRLYTMRHAILDVLNGKYTEFDEVIKNHFTMKKEYILKVCKQWTDEAIAYIPTAKKTGGHDAVSVTADDYKITFKKLEETLNKL